MNQIRLNRRDFFKLAGKFFLTLSGLLGAGGLLRILAYPGDSAQPTEFDMGAAQNYPAGSRTIIPAANALLVHNPDGFIAISLICTHLGCTLKPAENGFACPCHNSQFDIYGAVVHGPAVKPLEILKVRQTADEKLVLYRTS